MKRLMLVCLLSATLFGAGAAAAQSEMCVAPSTDYEATIEACTELIEQYPTTSSYYFSRAYAFNELGRYEDAIEDYTKVLFIYSKDTDAFNNRGFAYDLMGDYEQAIADYSRALAINPDYTRARVNRAHAYDALGLRDLAVADAQVLVDANHPDGYYTLATLAEADGDYETSIANYTEAINLDPFFSSAYLGRGYDYWVQGEFEAAAPDYYEWLLLEASVPVGIDPDDAEEPFTVSFNGENYFTLPVRGGRNVLLSASAVGLEPGIDPTLIVLDPDGNPIYVDDDTGVGDYELDASFEEVALPERGEYTLIIGFAGGGSFGDVEVTVEVG
jgi:tetratricopeptide (TPR) repeat protein